MATTTSLKCDMTKDCAERVTHVEDKGYVYCAAHAAERKGYGHRCRFLKPSEVSRLERGEALGRY